MANDNAQNNSDLQDSPEDQEKMKREETTIDLPEVNDIPGQENVKPLEGNGNTTISSADEEGEGLWPEDGDEADANDADISPLEKQLLDDSGTAIEDDENLRRAALDNTDEDGEALNEGSSDISGGDLDAPQDGANEPEEALGQDDEENSTYSLDDNNDNP